MSPIEIARAVRLRLAAELNGDRAALASLAASIVELVRAAGGDVAGVPMRTLAVAFQLERFYTALEGLLSRVLRTLDGDVPVGPEWHNDLLRAASVAVEGLRPALIPSEAVPLMRELLGFRHYARHGYDTTPEPRRVDDVASIAVQVHTLVEPALAALEERLRRP